MSDEITQLKDENEYLRCLKLGVDALKIYSETEDKKVPKSVFVDLLAEAWAMSKEESSSSISNLQSNCRTLLLKDFAWEYKKIVRTLSSAHYRRMFQTILRESEDFVLFNNITNNQDYANLLREIVDTDSNITSADKNVLLSMDANRLIINICNRMAHGNIYFEFVEEKKKKEYYTKTYRFFDKTITSDLPFSIEDSDMVDLLFNEENLGINFFSMRLNKNFKFSISKKQMDKIITLVAKQLKFSEKAKICNVGLKDSDTVAEIVKNGKNYILNNDEDKEEVLKLLEEYKKKKDPAILQQMLSYCTLERTDDVQREVILSTYEKFRKAVEDRNGFGDFPNRNDYFCLKIAHRTNGFDLNRMAFFIDNSLYVMKVLRLLDVTDFIKGNDRGAPLRGLMHEVIKSGSGLSSDADIEKLYGLLYCSQKENFYADFLLTETLLLLQLLEDKQGAGSKILWHNLGANSSVVQSIKNDYSLTISDEEVVANIRDSIQHLYYLTDGEAIEIYDGSSRNTIQHKFTIFVDELEKLKDEAYDILIEHNKNLIKEKGKTLA